MIIKHMIGLAWLGLPKKMELDLEYRLVTEEPTG